MGKTIQTIGLIGAGAVGSYVIWGTEGASGIDFRLIAEGGRAERLRNPGLVINGKTYTPYARRRSTAPPRDPDRIFC